MESGGFEFVFKGGTSMIILMPTPRRLSIDIDIASTASAAEYEPVLEDIGSRQPFLRQEEDERGNDRLPKRRHFKFFYNSIFSRREDYVLLDILEEDNHFPETRIIPIRTSFVAVERDVTVRVPSPDCLLGDKLTAFAPNTVGIPLTQRCGMQVVKQLFDIGELFNVFEVLEVVKETHAAVFAAENGYRGFKFTLLQALDDTIDTAALICGVNLRGGVSNERTRWILEGISGIANHLVGGRYRIDQARVSAAKAACLAAILKQNVITQTPADIRFDPDRIADLRDANIKSRPIMNRLKRMSPEAFYYWNVVDSLM